jgi:hypothetical protein
MEEIKVKVPPGKVCIHNGRCPNGCSLMNHKKLLSNKPVITAVVRLRGDAGSIHFNPFYGVFEYQSELSLHEGDIVDLYCPHCNVSLVVQERCPICKIPMFAIHLSNGGEVRACPTVGCRNHNLIIVDLDAQIAHYYHEERRLKM